MELTSQQLQAIDNGQPVPVSVQGRECVLLPEELFDRLRESLDEWHPTRMQPSIARLMDEDWNDPAMSVYDE